MVRRERGMRKGGRAFSSHCDEAVRSGLVPKGDEQWVELPYLTLPCLALPCLAPLLRTTNLTFVTFVNIK